MVDSKVGYDVPKDTMLQEYACEGLLRGNDALQSLVGGYLRQENLLEAMRTGDSSEGEVIVMSLSIESLSNIT